MEGPLFSLRFVTPHSVIPTAVEGPLFSYRTCYDKYLRQASNWRVEKLTVALEITQRETDGLYLLALRGRLALGEESAGFRSAIDNLLAAGAARIVVNLEHVHYVDSAGLGALIEAHRKIIGKGARLRLSNLGPNFRRALEIARLLGLFDYYATESAALTNF